MLPDILCSCRWRDCANRPVPADQRSFLVGLLAAAGIAIATPANSYSAAQCRRPRSLRDGCDRPTLAGLHHQYLRMIFGKDRASLDWMNRILPGSARFGSGGEAGDSNTAKVMPSMSVPWSWRAVATSTSPMRPFQNRFAMICEIPPVIASRRCWDQALTAITITISISIFSSEIEVPVFANGMCASRLPRRLKSRAGLFGWPPARCSLCPGCQRIRRSPQAPGQSDPPTKQTSCKAAP
jgi:hypothetical protein